MEDYIKEWMKEIINLIPSFFNDDQKIKEQLDNFVLFDNMDWWNIALVYYQRPNAVHIKSKKMWDSILQDLNKKFYIKKGERGIKIIVPIVEGDHFRWKSKTVWDISQSQQIIEIDYVSNLRVFINSIFNDEVFENVGNTDELLNYILQRNEYLLDSKMRKDNVYTYLKNCIYYILSNYIPYHFNQEIDLSIQLDQNDSILLYAILRKLIQNLHIYLKDYYTYKYARIKEEKQLDNAIHFMDLPIRDKISIAQKHLQNIGGKTEEQEDDEYSYYDQEAPTGQERRINDGYI